MGLIEAYKFFHSQNQVAEPGIEHSTIYLFTQLYIYSHFNLDWYKYFLLELAFQQKKFFILIWND